MLVDLLQGAFVVAGVAHSGREALLEADKLHPDILILDISLGDITGFEVARKLKKAGALPKIIFLSMHEGLDFVRAAFELGASGYVFKSRVIPDLNEAVRVVREGGIFAPIMGGSSH